MQSTTVHSFQQVPQTTRLPSGLRGEPVWMSWALEITRDNSPGSARASTRWAKMSPGTRATAAVQAKKIKFALFLVSISSEKCTETKQYVYTQYSSYKFRY